PRLRICGRRAWCPLPSWACRSRSSAVPRGADLVGGGAEVAGVVDGVLHAVQRVGGGLLLVVVAGAGGGVDGAGAGGGLGGGLVGTLHGGPALFDRFRVGPPRPIWSGNSGPGLC